tara:strand:+ start:352 stop:1158 length:807 start_codon:yes stop_codon:yes gene_type:complete
MTIQEAYDYIDMLLDKADQPYFTTEEKNRFLNLAISDFINAHYPRMGADEDSKRALVGCTDYARFALTPEEIVGGNMIYNDQYPALQEKYGVAYHNNLSAKGQGILGYWKYGNQYILPKQNLYIVSIANQYYNKGQIINPDNGQVYSGVTTGSVKVSEQIGVEIIPSREIYQKTASKDPFQNNSNRDEFDATYIEGRLVFSFADRIFSTTIISIILPTIEQAFDDETWDTSDIPKDPAFKEHYQKQIIEIAVNRMTQVDVGLMTGPAQ